MSASLDRHDAQRLYPETIRAVLQSALSGTYAKIGTPLVHSSRIFKFTNNGTADVFISWDGITDNEFVPKGSFILLDVATNKQLAAALAASANTQFWVRTSSDAASVYLSSYYGM